MFRKASPVKPSRSADPLLPRTQKAANPLHSQHQILVRVGDTEPQIALAVVAKCGSAQTRDACLFEQPIRQSFRRQSGASDIRERIERTAGNGAPESGQRV